MLKLVPALTAALTLVLAGCGGGETTSVKTEAATVAKATSTADAKPADAKPAIFLHDDFARTAGTRLSNKDEALLRMLNEVRRSEKTMQRYHEWLAEE